MFLDPDGLGWGTANGRGPCPSLLCERLDRELVSLVVQN